jgi:hypothetical protein
MLEISMTAGEMTLARYYAKQAVKAQWRAAGLKLHDFKASEVNRTAEAYLHQHREELIALATERYLSFVESGRLQRQRYRRKPGQ